MIYSVDDLKKFIDISAEEERDVETVAARYPMKVTPYYASLMDRDNPNCPIRLQGVPSVSELDDYFGSADPLEEDINSPVPGVIRVYPDRIAVVLTARCSMYCRHCLRKRNAGDEGADLSDEAIERIISYIAGDVTIRDVLLTGGDPLMFSDERLEWVLSRLKKIGHIELLRIGTRMPCTNPSRITESLADMLADYHPLWLSTQFNHPKELSKEAQEALNILHSRGIPVNNQSVLLRGINDSIEVMTELVRKLIALRVRPYYLYQAQTLLGTGHFVTSIEEGIVIIRGLRGHTTGFAVPQYVLDTPYGKIPINPSYAKGRDGDYYELESFDGRIWRENNPLSPEIDV